MLFNNNADVYTADGEQVGSINGIVIDPYDDEVTHLIVQQGVLFTEDKVMPVEWVDTTSEDRITLRPDIDDLEQLPKFEETHYVPRHEEDPPRTDSTLYPGLAPVYPYPHYGLGAWPTVGAGSSLQTAEHKHQNIPRDTEALKSGSKVYSSDNEEIGEVERVLMDENTNEVTHFVVKEGLIFKHRKLIPITWVRTLMENEIHLGVGSKTLDNLPEYDE